MASTGRKWVWRILVGRGRLPLWLKVVYTAFLCVLVPVYWRAMSEQNFQYLR
jgi:hypothetical protein